MDKREFDPNWEKGFAAGARAALERVKILLDGNERVRGRLMTKPLGGKRRPPTAPGRAAAPRRAPSGHLSVGLGRSPLINKLYMAIVAKIKGGQTARMRE